MQRKSANFLPAGFTLFELIIVLVILVAAAALAVPTIQRSFSSQRAFKAAELIRTELNRTRIAAMRTGEVHGFFYFPESENYKIAPFDEEVMSVINDRQSRNRNDRSTSNFVYGGERLPRGVLFADGETARDSRSEDAFVQNGSVGQDLRPVLFYPDGTSQSARLYLRSKDDDFVEIQLRGLTGTSKVQAVDDIRSRRR